MAEYGLSITKEVAWRGAQEEFSNVYHYLAPVEPVDTLYLNSLINAVVNAEKQVHGDIVTFKRAFLWTAGGTPAQNETVMIVDLSGVGGAVTAGDMDREATYLVQFKTSRPSITGRPVTLKKFIHACSLLGAATNNQLNGSVQLDAGTINNLMAYGNQVRQMSINGVESTLYAPSSVDRQAGEPFVFPWVEHHEFRY